MRALVLNGNQITYTEDYPKPVPGPGEVLVQVTRAGICETDLQLIQGYMGFEGVLGHEFVGIAQEGQYAGKRVVGEINNSCGQCDYCENGLSNHCPHRTVLGILNHDGAFADYVTIPEKNLHPVPDSLSDTEAVFTEPLAAAFEIPEQLQLHSDQHVVLLGAGRLGNLCAQVLNLQDCSLTVVGKHPNKLELLNQAGIKTILLDYLEREKTADVVVDCTGSGSGLETAFQIVKPRGTIVLKTTVAGNADFSLAPMVIDELNLIGSRCGPFDKALTALNAKQIRLDGLLSASYPFQNAVEAFQKAQEKGVLKVQLEMS